MSMIQTEENSVLIIGGGASGMMAAYSAALNGAKVYLFEKNQKLGKKLAITGKGRCNVTNDCDREEFLQNVRTNPRFLYTAFSKFSNEDTKAFFENLGVKLKVERGKRVFPVSDNAHEIVSAMEKAIKNLGVIIINEEVSKIIAEGGEIKGLLTNKNEYMANKIIVATGGASYKGTGSTGDGYRFAESVGHTIKKITPSLVPMVARGKMCSALQGLSLKNVAMKIIDNTNGKTVYEDFGEMMFTHFGITGPMVLSASAFLTDIKPSKYTAFIDMKPALDEKTLDNRILSDFAEEKNKDFCNSLDKLLPSKMIPIVVGLSHIDGHKKVNSITKEERENLINVIKNLSIVIDGLRPIDEAIITKGGVDISEINPKTMESKLIKGLYFSGEVLDLDAYTGGFNLQIAFMTGYVAGENSATLY